MNRQSYQVYGQQQGEQVYQIRHLHVDSLENQYQRSDYRGFYPNNQQTRNYSSNNRGNGGNWRNGNGGGRNGNGYYRSNNQQNYNQNYPTYDLKVIPDPQSPLRRNGGGQNRTPFREVHQNGHQSVNSTVNSPQNVNPNSYTPKKVVTFTTTSAGNSPVKNIPSTSQSVVPYCAPSTSTAGVEIENSNPVVFAAHLQQQLQPFADAEACQNPVCFETEQPDVPVTPTAAPPNSPMVAEQPVVTEPVTNVGGNVTYDVGYTAPATTPFYPMPTYQTGGFPGGPAFMIPPNAYQNPMAPFATYGPPFLAAPFGGPVGGFFGPPPPAYGPFYPQMMSATPQYGYPLVCIKCGQPQVEQSDMAINTEAVPSVE